jgi:dolichol-phosphate mannosyltransferase
VIPAHNEEGCIESTLRLLIGELRGEEIPFEIIVVNDNSADSTADIVLRVAAEFSEVSLVENSPPNGFGFAVRRGLNSFSGDCVAVFMADASDDPKDLVRFYRTMWASGVDCVFGTRFSRGGAVYDYPLIKWILNRFANLLIRSLFQFRYNDTTNAFKLYRRNVIAGLEPFLSHHFNLTVELPLKAIVRGFSYRVIPNSWTNRKTGVSKLKIREMGSRYLFIVLYCLVEKWLSRGDYRKPGDRVEGADREPTELELSSRPVKS